MIPIKSLHPTTAFTTYEKPLFFAKIQLGKPPESLAIAMKFNVNPFLFVFLSLFPSFSFQANQQTAYLPSPFPSIHLLLIFHPDLNSNLTVLNFFQFHYFFLVFVCCTPPSLPFPSLPA